SVTSMNLRRRLPAFVLALSAATSGCLGVPGPSTSIQATPVPSPASSGPATGAAILKDPNSPIAIFLGIERQVEHLRQLGPRTFVFPTLISESELRDLVASGQAGPTPASVLRRQDRYRAFGLIPMDAVLDDLEASLDESSTLGFYEPGTGSLNVVMRGGKVGAVDKATFSHEYTHALQDQTFDVMRREPPSADQAQDSD